MNRLSLLLAATALAVSACASMGQPAINYADYAGPAIPEFTFSQLYNWQRTGDKSVVVWTKPSTAYLLTLKHNCDALRGRVTVEIGGVDGIQGRLQAGSGDVIVGQLRCSVETIQPLDLQRLHRDQRS
jgi:hypothetical protein